MERRARYGFWFALLLVGSSPMSSLAAEGGGQSMLPPQDQEALLLGQQLLRLRQALAKPEAPDSMQAVLELGHQQAAYMMVRGWLSYQLQADLSLLAGNEQAHEAVRQRVTFLQQAIRRLDLE